MKKFVWPKNVTPRQARCLAEDLEGELFPQIAVLDAVDDAHTADSDELLDLINAADGYHLWSETFDRELDDVFDVQDEVTQAIVLAIEPALASSERHSPGRKSTPSRQRIDSSRE